MKSSLSVRQAIGAVALALMVLSGFAAPAVAANPDQAPPVAPGQSRVWFVRQLLPGGKIGEPGNRAYYEVCTHPKLLELARRKIIETVSATQE